MVAGAGVEMAGAKVVVAGAGAAGVTLAELPGSDLMKMLLEVAAFSVRVQVRKR